MPAACILGAYKPVKTNKSTYHTDPAQCYFPREVPHPVSLKCLPFLLYLPSSPSLCGTPLMKNPQPVLTCIFSELPPSTTLLQIKSLFRCFIFFFTLMCSVCLLNQIINSLGEQSSPLLCPPEHGTVFCCCFFSWFP